MGRAPWICPECGRTLRIKNQEHVCGRYDLESHFHGKGDVSRAAFDWLCERFQPFGEYDVVPMKTTIAFIRGANIAFLTSKKTSADVSFVLDGPVSSPRLSGSTPYGRGTSIHRVRISSEADLDGELAGWIETAQVQRASKY
ncbi:MAG: hypothetical protein JSS66_15260 [Armatimonadetes bacterium]|nr:hypothetical protein [Armatimonadota bacterium]